MKNFSYLSHCLDVVAAPNPHQRSARVTISAQHSKLKYYLDCRYRGIAVTVEDRDQTYDFMNVRDVVVLDPGVRCHDRCMLRGATEGFQRGWEFSVQVCPSRIGTRWRDCD